MTNQSPFNPFLFFTQPKNITRFTFVNVLLFFTITFLSAQPDIAWERLYGGDAREQGEFIKSTADGGFVTASNSYSDDGDVTTNYGGADWWITKKDGNGDIEWQTSIGGAIQDFPKSIEPTPDGGYIIIGSTLSTNQPSGVVSGPTYGGWDVWVVKLDMNGDLEWEKNYGGSGFDRGFDIKVVDQFGYMFVAHTDSNDNDINDNADEQQDIWVVFISDTGDILSEKTHGGSDIELAEKIINIDGFTFMIAGTTYSNDVDVTASKGESDFWLFKVSLQADLIWERTYGGSKGESLKDCIMTEDGGFLLVGNSASSDFDVSDGTSGADRWMIKLDADGEKEWDKIFDTNSTNYFKDVVQTADGKYLVIDSNDDVFLTDDQGNEEWKWEYQLQYDGYHFFDITTTETGGFALIGEVKVPLAVGFNDEVIIVNFEPIISTSCPDVLNGFVELGEFNGHKYFLSEGTSGAPDAQVVAADNGGYLAVINSQEENDFIQQNISEMVYIGLNDFDSEGNLVWVNGDPLDFDNINPCGFCNENADDQDFLIIQPWDGAWSFSNVFNQRKYLIEVPCNVVTPPVNPDDCAFAGSFNIVSDPYEICIEEDQSNYLITAFSKFDFAAPTNFFKTNAEISLDGALEFKYESPNFSPFSQSIYLSHSKNQDLVYVYDITLNKVRICDYGYNEMASYCIPYVPNFPPGNQVPIYNNLNKLQVLEVGDMVLIVMDSYIGMFLLYQGGNAIYENPNFLSGQLFGKPVQANDLGYYIQVDDFIVKVDEGLNIEWLTDLAMFDAESVILPIPNNDDEFYTFTKNGNQEVVYKVNDADGSIVWSKNMSTFLTPNQNWSQPRLRNGVVTLDGGFVTKLDYNINLSSNEFASTFVKLDGNGNTVVEEMMPSTFWPYEVNYATADGGYILTTSEGGNKLKYVKVNSLGKTEPVCSDNGIPDLASNISVSFSHIDDLTEGEFLNIYFEVVNHGLEIAGSSNLNVYLSKNLIIDNSDILVHSVMMDELGIGDVWPIDLFFEIPELQGDEYRFIISIDDDKDVFELSELNNRVRSPLFDYFNSSTPNCPDDLVGFTSLGEFGGSKYFLSNDVENPLPAQAIAESLGGYLATIDSQEENDFIFSQLSEMAYIGLSDFDVEGDLIWENGDPVNFTNFDICNFCNPNVEEMDFVVMHGWNGGWSWSNIFNQRKYIVEVPCTNTITTDPNMLIALLPNVLEETKPILRLENLFPNPANDFIHAKVNTSKAESIDLQIFDARGVLLRTHQVNLLSGENIIQLEIETLPSGFYSILIPKGEQGFTTLRFVK